MARLGAPPTRWRAGRPFEWRQWWRWGAHSHSFFFLACVGARRTHLTPTRTIHTSTIQTRTIKVSTLTTRGAVTAAVVNSSGRHTRPRVPGRAMPHPDLDPVPTPTQSPATPPTPPLPPAAVTHIYAISDVHADPAYPANWAWVEGLQREQGAPYSTSALILAGDVAEHPARLLAVLAGCAAAFAHVVFIPGNHCLWLRAGQDPRPDEDDEEEAGSAAGAPPRRPPADSVEKWRALEAAIAASFPGCVHTGPIALGGVCVAPLLSWYEGGWNEEPSPPGAPPAPAIFTDFRACVWPPALAPGAGVSPVLAEWWDAQNEAGARAGALERAMAEAGRQQAGRGAAGGATHDQPPPPLVTASHFLPFPACLPERRFLFQPSLADAAGSRALGRRVAALQPDVHVFGHTHIAMDLDVRPPGSPAGARPIRCVHWPLRYPAERLRASAGGGSPRLAGKPADPGPDPALVWTCGSAAAGQPGTEGRGAPGPRLPTHWSAYYAVHPRNPANVEPAPWVRERAAWARER
jgi:hypothetical protein